MASAPLNASCRLSCRQIYADSGRHRHWPPYADGYDFYRDSSEQKALTGSYALPSLGPLRLLRRFGNTDGDL